MELRMLLNKRGRHPRAIADVGGGDGSVLFDLAQAGVNVVCVDLDEARLTVGAQYAHGRGLPMVHVIGDALQLPIGDETCDAVFLSEILQTTGDPRRALIEAARVLAPGGCAVITAPNPRSPINAMDDPHHHLPLVGLLPAPLARRYVSLLGRRMPSLGEAFAVPDWSEVRAAIAAAGLHCELESSLLLKLADPTLVLVGWKRPIARLLQRSGIAERLRDGRPLAPLRRLWDRHIARSWLIVASKP